MTEFLEHQGGQLSYDVTGDGPLVVLSPGMGDLRQSYRFLAPQLARAGYRVATVDMRGHGDCNLGWPAVIVGQSLSGGAATIAAATEPGLVAGIVEINPFTRTQKTDLGALLRVGRYRRGGLRLMGTQIFRSLGIWRSYLNVAYPTKPA